jgi:diguanylate cyclase (GGDEF)-like protein
MARRGEVGAVGVLDLDDFKAVNTVHGHLSGDLVLQRVAGILARVMRREDFVARFGGDEFVLVLPQTTLEEASEVGNRVVAAIQAEDWNALVPNTPVTVTVGWARLDGLTELTNSFELADRAMLQAKTRTHSG